MGCSPLSWDEHDCFQALVGCLRGRINGYLFSRTGEQVWFPVILYTLYNLIVQIGR